MYIFMDKIDDKYVFCMSISPDRNLFPTIPLGEDHQYTIEGQKMILGELPNPLHITKE